MKHLTVRLAVCTMALSAVALVQAEEQATEPPPPHLARPKTIGPPARTGPQRARSNMPGGMKGRMPGGMQGRMPGGMQGGGMQGSMMEMRSRAEEGMITRVLNDPKMIKEVGLTDEQVTTLKDTMFKQQLEEVDLRAAHQKAGLEQAWLMTQKTVDEKAVYAVVDRIGEITTKIAKMRVSRLLLIKKTITDEQREKMLEVRMQHMRRGRSKPNKSQGGNSKKNKRWKGNKKSGKTK
ncbi:MAG: hypothetical protein JRC99_12060 [Deltaproteobacteria bacterium]|nr:hypothetical protein [Deltaproteobacteria bacterium]